MDREGETEIVAGRRAIQRAVELMDDGRYRESVEASILGSDLVMSAMLGSWGLEPAGSGCWEKLKLAGACFPVVSTAYLRHCCRKIDRQRHVYGGLDEERREEVFDEESAMEMVNYAREILKFAQRHLRQREGEPDLTTGPR